MGKGGGGGGGGAFLGTFLHQNIADASLYTLERPIYGSIENMTAHPVVVLSSFQHCCLVVIKT